MACFGYALKTFYFLSLSGFTSVLSSNEEVDSNFFRKKNR